MAQGEGLRGADSDTKCHPLPVRGLKVGGYIYRIIAGSVDLRETHMLGTCSSDELLISIDTTRSQQVMQSTLLHETLHAINFVYLPDEKLHLSEGQIGALANGLFQVLRDNRTLFIYILAEESGQADE